MLFCIRCAVSSLPVVPGTQHSCKGPSPCTLLLLHVRPLEAWQSLKSCFLCQQNPKEPCSDREVLPKWFSLHLRLLFSLSTVKASSLDFYMSVCSDDLGEAR